MRIGPRKFCNFVLAWAIKRMPSQQKYEEWLYQMNEPLPWETTGEVSREQLQKEAADFISTMQAIA